MTGTDDRTPRTRRAVSPVLGLHVAVLLFAASSLGGLVAAMERTSAWANVELLAICAGVYLATWLIARTERLGALPTVALSLIGAGVAAYFLTQYRFIAPPEKLPLIDRIGRAIASPFPRLGTWAPFPNSLGTVLDGLAGAALGLALSRRASSTRALGAIAAAAILLGLFVSESRGSWLAVIAAGSVAAMAAGASAVRLPRATVAVLAIAAVSTVAAGVYAAAAPGRPWWLRLAELGGRPDRVDVYDHALTLVRDAPFTGIGAGDQFAAALSRYALLIQVPFLTYSHNLALDVWLEQGLAGFAAWALLAAATAVGALAGERAGLGWRFRGLWAGVLAIHVHGLMDARQSVDAWTWWPLFALTGALAGALSRRRVRIGIAWALTPLAVAAAVAIAAVAGRGPLEAARLANTGAIAQAHADALGAAAGRDYLIATARQAFEAALALAPDDVPSLRRLGLIDLQEDEHAAALAHLKRAFAVDPTSRATAKAYGMAAMWSGDLDTAVPLLAPVPDIVAELNAWSYWRTTRAEPALALNAARASLALNADQPDVRARVRDLERAAGVAESAARP